MRLRTVLGVVGAFILMTGINVGFGGIATLGLQGPTDFVSIANPAAFQVQDSHVRFLGGVWLGVGLLFAAAAVKLEVLRPIVCAAMVLVIVGGVSRLSGGVSDLLLEPAVGPSLVAEVVLMPLLLWWTWRGATPAYSVE